MFGDGRWVADRTEAQYARYASWLDGLGAAMLGPRVRDDPVTGLGAAVDGHGQATLVARERAESARALGQRRPARHDRVRVVEQRHDHFVGHHKHRAGCRRVADALAAGDEIRTVAIPADQLSITPSTLPNRMWFRC